MDGRSRQDPAYRPAKEKPRSGGVFLRVDETGTCRPMEVPSHSAISVEPLGAGTPGPPAGNAPSAASATLPAQLRWSQTSVPSSAGVSSLDRHQAVSQPRQEGRLSVYEQSVIVRISHEGAFDGRVERWSDHYVSGEDLAPSRLGLVCASSESRRLAWRSRWCRSQPRQRRASERLGLWWVSVPDSAANRRALSPCSGSLRRADALVPPTARSPCSATAGIKAGRRARLGRR